MKWRHCLSALVTVVVLVVAACSQPGRVKRVLPGVSPQNFPETAAFSELSDATLASITVCNDTLGFDTRMIGGGTCLPCMPPGAMGQGESALRHARRLSALIGRAPHDTTYAGANCATLAYQVATKAMPEDVTVQLEFAAFRLASRNDSVRARGLMRIDAILDSLLVRDERRLAERLLGMFALDRWDRAQRMLERPPDPELGVSAWERAAHRLTDGAPPLRALPAIPRTSDQLGVSEAVWAARLFDRAAQLASDPARRSAWNRLALAPWVVLGQWSSLDSAAVSILARAPGDSAVLPARALAAFRRVRNPVRDYPAVMQAFDVALRAMPRADSLEYDSFDDVLRRDDDDWRYGFLPSDRLKLDARGWAVLDPVWSTAINEVRLAKRARVAEANFRYAGLAAPGSSGSETPAGQLFTRRGAVNPRWAAYERPDRVIVALRWPGIEARRIMPNVPDFWRAAYSDVYSPNRAAGWPAAESQMRCEAGKPETLLDCARADRSDWTDVPFWGTTDTIDVTVARFRAPHDSTDIYIAGRVPLRRFKYKNDVGSAKSDHIRLGAFLTDALGQHVYQNAKDRELPADRAIAWTEQWLPRVGQRNLMHRVEALEESRPAAARGALLHTSDAAVNMPLAGFGVSDILVAASSRELRTPARRWNDLAYEPNAAVVTPGAKFDLGWEIYDLTPAPDGRVRWRVSIRRENGAVLRRQSTRAVLEGGRTSGDRVLADEPDAPAVMYTRDEVKAAAVFEHLTFNMGAFPPGRHVVSVRIDDLVAKKSVERSVTVRVLDPESQRRGPISRQVPFPLR